LHVLKKKGVRGIEEGEEGHVLLKAEEGQEIERKKLRGRKGDERAGRLRKRN